MYSHLHSCTHFGVGISLIQNAHQVVSVKSTVSPRNMRHLTAAPPNPIDLLVTCLEYVRNVDWLVENMSMISLPIVSSAT